MMKHAPEWGRTSSPVIHHATAGLQSPTFYFYEKYSCKQYTNIKHKMIPVTLTLLGDWSTRRIGRLVNSSPKLVAKMKKLYQQTIPNVINDQ